MRAVQNRSGLWLAGCEHLRGALAVIVEALGGEVEKVEGCIALAVSLGRADRLDGVLAAAVIAGERDLGRLAVPHAVRENADGDVVGTVLAALECQAETELVKDRLQNLVDVLP